MSPRLAGTTVRKKPKSHQATNLDPDKRLSATEQAFVMLAVTLDSLTEAYRLVHPKSRRGTRQSAFNVAQRPNVAKALEIERARFAAERQKAIADAVTAAAKQAAKELVTRDWVIEKLRTNVERALQEEPVRDKDGNPTGEFTYEGAVANGALKLLGEDLGMFKQRLELTGKDGGPVEQVWKIGDNVIRLG